MRVNRAKLIRKYLKFYKIAYGICPPYKIILDGNFIHFGLKLNVDIEDRLVKLLQGDSIKLFIQQSTIDELVSCGLKTKSALDFARKACQIVDDSSFVGEFPSDKLNTMLKKLQQQKQQQPNNDSTTNKYDKENTLDDFFVATQDKVLRRSLAHLPGTPLLYFNKVTIVLEPPSESSRNYNTKLEQNKSQLTTSELEMLHKVSPSLQSSQHPNNINSSTSTSTTPILKIPSLHISQHIRVKDSSNNIPIQLRKRKAKSPNPLSTKPPDENSSNSKRKKLNNLKRGLR